MDYVLPNELVDGMITAGGKKATVSIKNLLIRGFYSGAILGLAVILALTVGILTKLPFVGSLLFPFGFASIVLFGMELVTGNLALLPMATWAGKCSWGATFRNWTWVWIGNFIGTACGADHGHQPHQRNNGCCSRQHWPPSLGPRCSENRCSQSNQR
jgi:formate/nitrite transporter FocA (FNT family)